MVLDRESYERCADEVFFLTDNVELANDVCKLYELNQKAYNVRYREKNRIERIKFKKSQVSERGSKAHTRLGILALEKIFNMAIKKLENQKELKEHGNYAFPVNISIEKIESYETGTFLWKLLEQGTTVDEMTAKMLEEYDADEELVRADVLAFCEKLEDAGIIE